VNTQIHAGGCDRARVQPAQPNDSFFLNCAHSLVSMNAFQPQPRPTPPEQRRPRLRPKRLPRSASHRAIALESLFKLSVNSLLALVAIVALIQWVPLYASRQAELRQLQAEVRLIETRVQQLRADMTKEFDPARAKATAESETGRVPVRQRPIRWQSDRPAQPDLEEADGLP